MDNRQPQKYPALDRQNLMKKPTLGRVNIGWLRFLDEDRNISPKTRGDTSDESNVVHCHEMAAFLCRRDLTVEQTLVLAPYPFND